MTDEHTGPERDLSPAERFAMSDGEVSDDFCLWLWRDAWSAWLVRVLDVEGIEGADKTPRIVRVRDAPSPGMTTFATLTGSRFADPDGRTAANMNGEQVPIHLEYSAIVAREHEASAMAALRFALATMYRTGEALAEGTTGGPVFGVEALGERVNASHMLVVGNRFGFGQQPMRDRVLEMLQLLPITPQEEAYCADHGYSGMLGALLGRLFNPADLNRASIVEKDAEGVWQAVGLE